MKHYLDSNVWDETQKRLNMIFSRFSKVYVSFSGGKDSGVLLNLACDYIREHYPKRKIGVFFMDYEAQYQLTIDYVQREFEHNLDIIEPYWFCVPLEMRTNISNIENKWFSWDTKKSKSWVREIPNLEYVYAQADNPVEGYRLKMSEKSFQTAFGAWYSQGEDCACLVGIRASESLDRFRSTKKSRVGNWEGVNWSTKRDNVVSFYPLYDWETEDIWTANAQKEWDYNKLYDLYYLAGVSIHDQRVASPFLSEGVSSLELFRAIEPETWSKLVGRVAGVNSIIQYKSLHNIHYNNITKPKHFTWQEYCEFLLATLPNEIAENYRKKFEVSLKFWSRTGGGLSKEIVEKIQAHLKGAVENGISNYGGKKDKIRIIFPEGIPDSVDFLDKDYNLVGSWKRMCLSILKHDHQCKLMGFSLTKKEVERERELLNKYKTL